MIKPVPHPSSLLQSATVDLLRKEAAKAALHGELTSKQLKLFYDKGWFKALVPRKYGGLQWSLATVIRFEEAIGWAEGSVGWVFTLCSGAGWFGGFIEPRFAAKIFKPRNACLAGSGAVGGTASEIEERGSIVTGQWKYTTGAPHATMFTANVYLKQEDKIRAVLLLPEEVTIIHNWKPIGLIASASLSFNVKKIRVAEERWFDIDPDKALISEALYRMPFGPLAEATIAANLSGMALHFMEEVELLWAKKKSKLKADGLREGKLPDWMVGAATLLKVKLIQWGKARLKLWKAVESLEHFVANNLDMPRIQTNSIYKKEAAAVSNAAQRQAALCREIVNELYPYTGLTGASADSAIGKVWRDFQTGSQHALFVPEIKTKER